MSDISSAVELARHVDEAWRPFRQAVDVLDPAALSAPRPGGWTAQEMIAHVAFWDEAVVPVVTYMLRGLAAPDGWRFGSGWVVGDEWPGEDVHNAREAAWAREQPAAVVLARLDEAHERTVGVLATVTSEELAAHQQYFRDIGGHYTEHLGELTAPGTHTAPPGPT